MARRRESVLDLLLVLPWWVAFVVGGVGYVAIAFIPIWVLSDGMLEPITNAVRMLAFIWLGACVLTGLGSAARAFVVARRFDALSGLDEIRALSWRQFESLVGEGFRRRGFSVVENARGGADGGVDLVLRKDSNKFLVQCKQWRSTKVGVKPVRELFGIVAASNAAGGFFVTSGHYTEEAHAFAKEAKLELLGGEALVQLMLDARRAEPFLDPTQGRRHTSIGKTDVTPSCPKCHGAMVRRTAARGASAGAEFWGCLQFPLCRGTRDVEGSESATR